MAYRAPDSIENPPPTTGEMHGPKRPRKRFVLFFDGTGNKFSGTDSDSNILKILRMLDRSDATQVVYYQVYIIQPLRVDVLTRLRVNSWIQKTRDSAIGTSFDYHVMGGYKFLMKYYTAGDDIYFFGFSRGAYIARFLAEMLDYVGLLEPGNEEMARFAWKAFSQWQMRLDGTEEERENKKQMFKYLTAFRDTFARPVRRIRFLGLFDTVNSVPRFENAWMQRSKFPYTAKSSALVIRHAVGIDERRAKFRQDLIGEVRQKPGTVDRGRPAEKAVKSALHLPHKDVTPHKEMPHQNERYRRKSQAHQHHHKSLSGATAGNRSGSPGLHVISEKDNDGHSIKTTSSMLSLPPPRRRNTDSDDEVDDSEDEEEAKEQDILEIWFPGGHADIGGGWPREANEDLPLSHCPLVWMVREARKAGLRFDEDKMVEMRCLDPEDPDGRFSPVDYGRGRGGAPDVPHFKFSGPESPDPNGPGASSNGINGIPQPGIQRRTTWASKPQNKFQQDLENAAQTGVLHDCLEFGQGLTRLSVMSWSFMEYLPFKRMDLMPDNSWKSIRWPLPKGEVRDMPDHALIHTSALRRMEANPKYRPGNLIIGGGGRGVKRAGKEHGVGEWIVGREEGDAIGECVKRKNRTTTFDSNETAAEKEKEKGKTKEHN